MLAGTVPACSAYTTLQKDEVVAFEPRDPGRVSMYVCGPTVYDVPHLGHGRFSLVFDILRRYLLFRGLEVTYVSNVTDIDDNIINRAARDGRAVATDRRNLRSQVVGGDGRPRRYAAHPRLRTPPRTSTR